MTTHTIVSSKSDEGNEQNFTRNVEVTERNGWIELRLTNHWRENEEYEFAISRKAAEELMTTLDLMLTADGEELEGLYANVGWEACQELHGRLIAVEATPIQTIGSRPDGSFV